MMMFIVFIHSCRMKHKDISYHCGLHFQSLSPKLHAAM